MKNKTNIWQMKNKNSIGHNRSLLNTLPQKLIILVLAIALLTSFVSAADITAKEGGDLYVDGKLGVGTTSPSERFEVVGNVTFPYGSSAGFFYDNSTGRVGIGTAIPNHKTVIDSSVNVPALSITSSIANTQWTGIQFGYGGADGNSSQYHKAGILFERVGSNAVGSLHFATDNTADTSNVDLSDARMTITRQGNVGIGDSNPSHKLSVNGNVSLSAYNMMFIPTGNYPAWMYGIYGEVGSSNTFYISQNWDFNTGVRPWTTASTGTTAIKMITRAGAGNRISLMVNDDDAAPTENLIVGGDGVVTIPDLGGGGALDVCTDNDGDLSAGAGCTVFEDLESAIPEGLTTEEFIIKEIRERLYTNRTPYKKQVGTVFEYYYTVQFKIGTDEVIGTIKVPKTMNDDNETFGFLRQKIEEQQGISFTTNPSTSDLIDKKINFKDISYREEPEE